MSERHSAPRTARAFRPEIVDAEANPDLYGLRRSGRAPQRVSVRAARLTQYVAPDDGDDDDDDGEHEEEDEPADEIEADVPSSSSSSDISNPSSF